MTAPYEDDFPDASQLPVVSAPLMDGTDAITGQRLVDVATETTDDDTEEPGPAQTLSRATIRVELEGLEPFTVPVDNRDYVAWDLSARREGWGGGQEQPFLFQTFLAYSAAKRAGRWSGTFAGFRGVCVLAAMEAAEPARPTR